MTIQRVNVYNWKLRDELFSSEMNDVDENLTHGLDKRAGETDILSSEITVTGQVDFASGSDLILQNPETLRIIDDGYLSIGAELRGDTRGTNTDPLRFGYEAVVISSTTTTLLPVQYNTFTIKFIGVLTDTSLVEFPAVAGYAKLIDNMTTTHPLILRTVGGTQGIVMQPGEKMMIYCVGEELAEGPRKNRNTLIQIQEKSDGYSFSTPDYMTTSSSSLTLVTGASGDYSLPVVAQAADIIEIYYSCMTKPSGTLAAYVQVEIQINGSPLNETIFVNQNGFGTAIPQNGCLLTNYTVPSDGTYYVEMYIKSSSGTAELLKPLTLITRLLRP